MRILWSALPILALTAALLHRRYRPVPHRVPQLVEVAGQIERPGIYALDEPTVAEVARRAGIEGLEGDTRWAGGMRVLFEGAAATLTAPSDPLLFAQPVDPNQADTEALVAIPGIGPVLAERILTARAEAPFFRPRDLRAVVGARRWASVRPFVDIVPTRIDLNTAPAPWLRRLPGIGPALAARIVADRERRGPYRSLADLMRVRGIGPATIERLRGEVRP